MPNVNTHKDASTLVGFFTDLIFQNSLSKKNNINFDQLIFSTLTWRMMATLPDILEPATDPNHRNFFHSAVFAILVGKIGYKAFEELKLLQNCRKANGIEEMSFNEVLNFLLFIGSGSYILHLIMDGTTPKGLPFI